MSLNLEPLSLRELSELSAAVSIEIEKKADEAAHPKDTRSDGGWLIRAARYIKDCFTDWTYGHPWPGD
jgi:hypothetical protein